MQPRKHVCGRPGRLALSNPTPLWRGFFLSRHFLAVPAIPLALTPVGEVQ